MVSSSLAAMVDGDLRLTMDVDWVIRFGIREAEARMPIFPVVDF
jgi:hypothetical protein